MPDEVHKSRELEDLITWTFALTHIKTCIARPASARRTSSFYLVQSVGVSDISLAGPSRFPWWGDSDLSPLGEFRPQRCRSCERCVEIERLHRVRFVCYLHASLHSQWRIYTTFHRLLCETHFVHTLQRHLSRKASTLNFTQEVLQHSKQLPGNWMWWETNSRGECGEFSG